MHKFLYEHCLDKDIIRLKNLPRKELIREFFLLKDRLSSDPAETGSATDSKGNKLKRNNALFLSEVYTPEFSDISPAGKIFGDIFKEMRSASFPAKSSMNYFKTCTGFNCLLSSYNSGSYYKPHRDNSILTMLIWPMEKTFEGGDLILEDIGERISCDAGTGLIFPSHYRHAVEPVKVQNDKETRVTFTGFVE